MIKNWHHKLYISNATKYDSYLKGLETKPTAKLSDYCKESYNQVRKLTILALAAHHRDVSECILLGINI